MLTAVKAVAFHRPDFDLVDAGPQSWLLSRGNYFVTLANLDICFALASSVQMDSHPPAPDSIPLNERIW
jgi:hypothetical protein